jgi:hypothetical protein
MSFMRIKTVKGRRYLYRQISRRKRKTVLSIMEYICALGAIAAAASPGRPGGFSGNRPTDKRQIREQEQADRELFAEDSAAFNVKQRQDCERQQKARDAAREARDRTLSTGTRGGKGSRKGNGPGSVKESLAAAQVSRSDSEPTAK